MSLRRLYLCFTDLIDLLEACAESLDDAKKKSLYSQIEPSVGLIRVRLHRVSDHTEHAERYPRPLLYYTGESRRAFGV